MVHDICSVMLQVYALWLAGTSNYCEGHDHGLYIGATQNFSEFVHNYYYVAITTCNACLVVQNT